MARDKKRIEQLQRRTQRPMTPGEMVAALLEELELSQTDLAARLGVSRATVNELVRGKRALSPDMAHRLGRFFGNGPGLWLRAQTTVDLWGTLHMDTDAYQGIQPHRVAA